MSLRGAQPLRHADIFSEPPLNRGLEDRIRGRLTKRLATQGDRALEPGFALDVTEKNERLRPQSPLGCVCDEVACEHAGPAGIARLQVHACSRDRPSMMIVAGD